MTDRSKFKMRPDHHIDLFAAVSIPVAVGPFGYLLGTLFVTHVVSSEARAIWMSTVVLISLTFLAYTLLFVSDR